MRAVRTPVFVAAVALLLPRRAFADEPAGSRAEVLYEEAKKLSAEQHYAEACPKFEESQKLEPAIGTQFNLADCFEHIGRAASALAAFREVVRVARMTNNANRLKLATERADALEAKVPRLRLRFAEPTQNAVVRIDGVVVENDTIARGAPVDPGPHALAIQAPGRKSFASDIAVGAAGADVEVPKLERDVERRVELREVRTPPKGLRIAAYVTGGLGVVGLGLGTFFGLSAIGQKSDAGCNGNDCRGGGDADKLEDAKDSGTIATVAFIAGGVLAATGVTLFVLSIPKSQAQVSATMNGARLSVAW